MHAEQHSIDAAALDCGSGCPSCCLRALVCYVLRFVLLFLCLLKIRHLCSRPQSLSAALRVHPWALSEPCNRETSHFGTARLPAVPAHQCLACIALPCNAMPDAPRSSWLSVAMSYLDHAQLEPCFVQVHYSSRQLTSNHVRLQRLQSMQLSVHKVRPRDAHGHSSSLSFLLFLAAA